MDASRGPQRLLWTAAVAACAAVFGALLEARAGGIGPALFYGAGLLAAVAFAAAVSLVRLPAARARAIEPLLAGSRAAFGVVVLGLVLFEAISRIDHAPPAIQWTGGPITDWRQPDPQLGWANVPHFRSTLAFDSRSVPFAFNARGFRDIEQEPEPDRPRVVILGDSYPIGWGGPYAESVAPRLRPVLPGVQIFNAACTGYSRDQIALSYAGVAAELRPDVVVVMFMAFPGQDRSEPLSLGLRKPWFELAGGNVVLRGVPVQQQNDAETNRALYRQFEAAGIRGPWTALRFLLVDFPRRYLALGERLLPTFDPEAVATRGLPPLDVVEAAILADLRRQVEADGARLVVALAPDARILTHCTDPVAAMRPYLASYRAIGIDPIDITPFVAADWRECYNGAMHPNGTGIDRMRGVLAARIRAALDARVP